MPRKKRPTKAQRHEIARIKAQRMEDIETVEKMKNLLKIAHKELNKLLNERDSKHIYPYIDWEEFSFYYDDYDEKVRNWIHKQPGYIAITSEIDKKREECKEIENMIKYHPLNQEEFIKRGEKSLMTIYKLYMITDITGEWCTRSGCSFTNIKG